MLNNLFNLGISRELTKIETSQDISSRDKIKELLEGPKKKSSFFKRVCTLFSVKSKEPNISLHGRIHREFEHTGQKIINQLERIKSELKKDVTQPFLFDSFEYAVNPLLRDFQTLQKHLSADGQSLDSTYTSFRDWVERAKLWSKLSGAPEQRDDLIKTIVNQLVEHTHTLIDRDLKTIHVYIDHEVDALPIQEHEKEACKNHLMHTIAGSLESLRALKKPETFGLEQALCWRNELDAQRTKYFESILQEIGTFVEHESLANNFLMEKEKNAALQDKAAELETKVSSLLESLEQNTSISSNEKQQHLSRLRILEKQWRDLYPESHTHAKINSLFHHLKGELTIARILLH